MRPPLAPSLPEWPTDECSDCSIVAARAADRRWSTRCTVGRPRAPDTDQEPGLISPMTHNAKEALIALYKHLRAGDPPTMNNARNVLESLLSNSRHYFLEQPRHAPYGNCTFLRLRGRWHRYLGSYRPACIMHHLWRLCRVDYDSVSTPLPSPATDGERPGTYALPRCAVNHRAPAAAARAAVAATPPSRPAGPPPPACAPPAPASPPC